MSRPNQRIPCPLCGCPMQPGAKTCRTCYSPRPRSSNPDTVYARSLGVKTRVVIALGGHEKLKALSSDARALLLKPIDYGNSRTVADGGMAARSMKPGVPASRTQNHPIEVST